MFKQLGDLVVRCRAGVEGAEAPAGIDLRDVEGAGEGDEETGGIRFDGIVNDPVFDREEIYYFLLRIEDNDHHTWEIWFQGPEGDYSKFATVKSTRAE